MVECDHCTEDVFSVWRFRERGEEMTHTEPVWVCADCHPDLIGAGHRGEDPSTETERTTAL